MTDPTITHASPPAARSTFVTVLAWVFIVLAGLATLISGLQNLMLHTMMPTNLTPPTGPGAEHMPAFMRWMLSHIRLFFLAVLLLSASTLAAAIGLLKRRNWARLAIVTLLTLGIVWNLGALVLQQQMMAVPLAGIPGPHHADFEQTFQVMRIASAAIAVGISLLFAWLIKRLCSVDVRAEFAGTAGIA